MSKQRRRSGVSTYDADTTRAKGVLPRYVSTNRLDPWTMRSIDVDVLDVVREVCDLFAFAIPG